jgi:twitching motility protein PilT
MDFGYDSGPPGTAIFSSKDLASALHSEKYRDIMTRATSLPAVVAKLANSEGNGAGTATGSGKSTTLRHIDQANKLRKDHILTIEDPIEFVPRAEEHCQSPEIALIPKLAAALRGALREDPDIILVGEMRDLETIALALEAAMTGHLVFATLHTLNASKTVDRMIEIFPANQQEQVRSTLADALRAVISQTLFKRVDIKGRCAALEILICTAAVRNLIREGKTFQLPSAMQTGKKFGMQTLDDAILELLKKGHISPEAAYNHSVEKSKFIQYLRQPPVDFT